MGGGKRELGGYQETRTFILGHLVSCNNVIIHCMIIFVVRKRKKNKA